MAKPRKTKRKEKAVKRRPKRRKTIAMHRVRDISPVTMLLAAIIVATLIYYFVSNSMLVNEGPPIT